MRFDGGGMDEGREPGASASHVTYHANVHGDLREGHDVGRV